MIWNVTIYAVLIPWSVFVSALLLRKHHFSLVLVIRLLKFEIATQVINAVLDVTLDFGFDSALFEIIQVGANVYIIWFFQYSKYGKLMYGDIHDNFSLSEFFHWLRTKLQEIDRS